MRYSALVAILLVWSGWASAEPGIEWQFLAANGPTQRSPIQGAVESYARKYKPTAVMVVQDGLVVATSGDISRRVNVRSVRKSFLSALFGVAIERGQIKLESTLGQLGIDDTAPSLTADEKLATVRQLLMARSGVYHPAAYETSEQKSTRPPRGAHPPGTFWYYNNWDFNALGAIYERATGSNVFDSFEKLIARPLRMQDFTTRDGTFIGDHSSLFPAYVFSMSARDLARFGLLFLNKGRWNDVSVVPSHWTAESTKAYSETDRKDRGYGYLWWTLGSGAWRGDAIFASGYGGQLIVIVPEKRLVAVQVVELNERQQGIHSATFLELVRQVSQDTAGPSPFEGR
ncbi:serine hydrolase [Bradyrhizobium sp. CB2312]|uniref:serine hydrolase domain-containing protein n=1 Tax=Bradyrhizobium sp. CB2312 TaxID=3039155 RepID=UPI0024B2193A|nr:serine hydrolase [Bradyrhizobium sp. CB2312]WFU76744.1 serine hydrolase [Bradyrhizobium sp. CB2312]